MKVLLLCPHFDPDLQAATGEVMTRLVESLSKLGHQVDVVTSLPWYQGHKVASEWTGKPWRKGKTPFGEIVRVWPFPTDKSNVPARALGFGGFTSLAAAAAMTMPKPDVVMAMSPPIFLGDAGWLVAKRWGVPFVFNTQDIFPDVAQDLGALTNPRVLSLARRHELSVYRRADAVTVLSADQQKNVSAKLGPSEDHKVHVIRNFVDSARIRPTNRDNAYRRFHGLDGKTVVMYSGNVGLSQSFELVRVAADRWAEDSSLHFVINGEGAARPTVESWAASRRNVSVVDFAPREKVNEVLGAADLHLILLKSGLARSSTPSKLYSILAAGRAVLASIDVGSEVDQTVNSAKAGLCVPPDEEQAFLAGLDKLLADRFLLEEMGRNGRSYASGLLSADAQAVAYQDLFKSLSHPEEI